jgi:hypothetical protein
MFGILFGEPAIQPFSCCNCQERQFPNRETRWKIEYTCRILGYG